MVAVAVVVAAVAVAVAVAVVVAVVSFVGERSRWVRYAYVLG